MKTDNKIERLVIKYLDDELEKNFIYKIKFPEATNFIKKLLNISPKRPSADIQKEFEKDLPQMVEKLVASVKSDPAFKNFSGDFALSNTALNQLLYERIIFKGVKQLGLTKKSIDTVFENINKSQLEPFLKKVDDGTLKDADGKVIDLSKELSDKFFSNAIFFPHLYDLEKLNDSVLTTGGLLKYVIPSHIENMQKQIDDYKGKVGREGILEQSLRNLIAYNIELIKTGGPTLKALALPENKINEYTKLLEETQTKINAQAKKYHETHHKPSTRLTTFEQRAIALFHDRDKIILTEQDKQLIADFVEYSIDNKEFNKRLGKILKNDPDIVSQYGDDIRQIYKFTHKTDNFNKIISDVGKISHIVAQIETNPEYKFSEKEKLKLSDIGSIIKFNEIDILLEEFSKLGLNDKSAKIKSLSDVNENIEKYMVLFADKVVEQTSFEAGDIVMDVAKHYHKLGKHKDQGIKGFIQDKIITSYSHAAIGIQEKDEYGRTTSGVKEIIKELQNSNVSLSHALISKTFRVYPDGLLKNAELKQKVEEALAGKEGDTLRDKLHKMYGEITNELLSEESLGNSSTLTNNESRRERAGLADFIPFGHQGKENVRSWASKVLGSDDLGKAIQDKGDGKIICSEFAAKITVLALVKLEQVLAEEIQKKDPSFKMPDKGLLKMPFNKNEDLGKVHPARLVNELKKAGAIEKVEQPKIVSDVIRGR